MNSIITIVFAIQLVYIGSRHSSNELYALWVWVYQHWLSHSSIATANPELTRKWPDQHLLLLNQPQYSSGFQDHKQYKAVV